MNKFLCGSLFLFFTFSMSSCSLKQLIKVGSSRKKSFAIADSSVATDTMRTMRWANLPAPDTFASAQAVDTAGIMQQLIGMVTPIWNARLTYRTMNGKAKVHFEGPNESQDFTANIRVKKDSAIWVDITALGGMVHAARVLITNDSFYMINYLQKECSKLALANVAKVLPTKVDFLSLQNLVTGEPLRSGNIVDVAELGSSWLVHVADSSYLQTLNCSKTDSSINMDQVNTRDPNGPQATMKFNRFEYTCGKRIAMSRIIDIQNLQDKFLLEMDFQNIEFDKELEMPFNIPAKFTQKQ